VADNNIADDNDNDDDDDDEGGLPGREVEDEEED
jgi:hypothetical protein